MLVTGILMSGIISYVTANLFKLNVAGTYRCKELKERIKMGLFKDYVSQTRKPEGFPGKMMLNGMNHPWITVIAGK